jgi:NTE family protein
MSYLLFTPKYTRELIDIGYNDATQRIDEIEDFLYPISNGNGRSDGVLKSKLLVTAKRPTP